MEIILKKYNDKWPEFFDYEKKMVSKYLSRFHVDSIEHIGATSACLCDTTGTIDVLIGLNSFTEVGSVTKKLSENGYTVVDKLSTPTCAFLYRKNADGNIVATFRICENASLTFLKFLGFKFYLSGDPKNAVKYNEFRKTLIEECKGNIKVYNQIKANYINSIIDEFCKFN